MPSCGCQSISHYPSSRLSRCITRTPWLRHTKEQRASPETSLQQRPIRSILQTNWWETPRKKTRRKQQQQATTKTGEKRTVMGISFILKLPLSADPGGSTGAQIGMREEVKGENVLSHKLTAHVQALSVAFSFCQCAGSVLVNLFCTLTLCLNLSPPIYLSALDSHQLPFLPLRCLLSNTSSVASYLPFTWCNAETSRLTAG